MKKIQKSSVTAIKAVKTQFPNKLLDIIELSYKVKSSIYDVISKVFTIIHLIVDMVVKSSKLLIFQVYTMIVGMPYFIWRMFVPKRKYGSHPVSKFFRKVLEYKKIQHTVGINIVILFIVGLVLKFPLYAIGGYHDNSFEEVIEEVEMKIEPVISTGHTFIDPVAGYISQQFHWYHPGIDIAGNENNIVHPIASGKVVLIQKSRYGYGNQIMIAHGDGIYSRYAHLNMIKVEINQSVTHDSIIGYSGNTGFSTGPHLHLEIYKDKKAVNPLSFIPNNYSTNYISLNQEPTAEISNSLSQDNLILGIATTSNEASPSAMQSEVVIKEIGEGFEEPFGYTASPSAQVKEDEKIVTEETLE